MSTTIDQKVVEMRFDNQHFEKNVATSMSTLDKLKQKLNLTSSAKGLENINASAKKVDMSGVAKGVETVRTSFSALEVMGVTALANITNSAVNAGKRIVKALTIEPVYTGFQEYETQINAVQTILANTQKEGTTIKEVNAALDELNLYADKTIYNFTEMTRNIGTFTAAGVKLDTSVSAIQGIANLAAVSGSTSQQASTAMYQLSQALAAGTVKLMDWNSVVNAGMGGQVFQDALKETSELLGTGAEAAIEAQGSFRESLSTGWLTAEVLTETLKKFTTSGANEYVAEYTGLSKEAVEAALEEAEARYGEADAIDKAAEALANKSGKNKKEIADALQFAKTAEDAATKVKTFTQLWDVLKEAAQSGWSQTWRLIIGDFEEAKSLFTPLSEFLTNIINKVSDARNKLLESALGMGFDKLYNSLNKTLEPIKKVADGVKNIAKTADKVTSSLGSLSEIVDDVIIGKFGNGEERYNKLTEAGENYYKIQNKVNEALGDSYRHSEKKIKAQDKLLAAQKKTNTAQKESTKSTSKNTKETNKLTKAQKNQLKELVKMNEEQLRSKGYTDEQIDSLKELKEIAESLGIPLDTFIDKLDEINGRWLLLESFKNIGKSITKIFESIGTAYRNVFDPIKPEQLFNAIGAFHKFTSELIISDETADKLTRTFNGLFAAIDIVTTIFGSGFKLAFTVLNSVLRAFNTTFLDFTALIGDGLYKLNEWLSEHNFITKFIDSITAKIPEVIGAIKDFVDSLNIPEKSANAFNKIASGLSALYDIMHSTISKSLVVILKIIDAVLNLFGTNLLELGEKIADIIIKLRDWIEENTLLIDGVNKIAKIIALVIEALARFAKAFMELKPVQELIENIKDAFSKLFDKFDFKFDGKGLDRLYNFLEEIFDKIENGIKNLDESALFQAGLNIVEGLANGIASGVGQAVEAICDIAKSIIDAFCSMLGIHSPSTVFIKLASFIISGILIGLSGSYPKLFSSLTNLASNIIDIVASIFTDGVPYVVDMVKMLGKKIVGAFQEWDIDFGSLIIVGVMIGVMVLANKLINVLDKIVNPLSKLGGLFDALKSSIQKFAKAKAFETKTNGILNIAKAIGILAGSFFLLSRLDWSAIGKGTVALLAISGALLLLTAVAGRMDAVEFGKMASFLLSFSISVLILSKAMDMLSGLSFGEALVAIVSMAAMVGGMTALLYAFGKFVDDPKIAKQMNKAGKMFIKMAAAMIIMAAAIKIAASISPGDVGKGIAVIASVVVLFGTFLLLGSIAKNADKAGSMILKMAIALAIIPFVIKTIAGISNGDIIKGLAVIAAIELLFAAVIFVSYFAGAHASKAGTMLLKMSIAIGILAMTMKLIASMSYNDIQKGLLCIAGIEILFAAFIAVSSLAQGANKAGSMMFKMAAGMAVMGLAIMLIASIPMADIIKGIAVIAAIEVLYGAMMVLSNFTGANADKAGSMMLKMSAAILVLVVAIALMSLLDPKDVAVGTAAISALLACFALIAKAVGAIGNCMKELIVIAATIALLVGAVIALTFIDPERVKTASVALSAILAMLALLVASTKFVGNANASILILVGVVAALAGVLYVLSELKVESSIANATALSILALALSVSLVILSKVGNNAANALYGVGLLLTMAAPLLAFVGVLALMSNVENAITNATALAVLAGALTLMLIPLTVVGTFAIEALFGVGVLLAMAVPLLAFVGILALMNKVDNVADNVNQLTSLMNVLLKMLTVLAVVGPLAAVGVVAMAGLIVLMGVVGTFATVVGGLVTLIPALGDFLDAGIPILEKLAYAIGSIAGNLVAGFADSALNRLPEIGTYLGEFMTNAQPFIDGAKTVDDTVLTGVGILAAAVAALSAANLIESITSFMSFGSSFSNLGTELSNFIENASPFIETVKTFTPDMFEGVESLTKAIITLTAASFLDAISNFLSLGSPLTSFGDQLPSLGESLNSFVSKLGVFSEEQVNTVKCAADAIIALSEAGERINGQSELGKALFGDNGLGAFSDQLPDVAEDIAGFVEKLGTFSEDQVNTVKCAADAIVALAEAGGNISGRDGWAKALFGETGLGAFAADLPTVGENLAGFVEKLGTFTEDQVTSTKCAGEVIKALADAGSNINGQSEWGKALFGDNGLGAFSKDLPDVAENLAGFVEKLGTFSDDSITTVKSAVGVIKALAEMGNANISGLITYLPTLGDQLIGFAEDLVSFCNKMSSLDSDAVAGIASDLVNTVSGLASKITESNSSMAKAGTGLVDALAAGIKDGKDTVNSAATSAVSGASETITGEKDSFESAGETLGKALGDGIKAKNDSAKKAAESLCKAAKNAVSNFKDTFNSLGGDLGQGLVNGIESKWGAAYQAGYALGQQAAQGEKDGQASNSPSKLTYQAGIWLGEGLVNGMAAMGKAVYRAGYDMGDTATSSMNDSIKKISRVLDADMDVQPTITPVLDLDDVKTGIGAIGGMFSDTTVGVAANVSAINSMMNDRNQNGGFGDVVSAINKLRKDLGDVSSTTYNVNGVTYDDGSNIADAVKSIAKAALRERRV